MSYFLQFLKRVRPKNEAIAQQVESLKATLPRLSELYALLNHEALYKAKDSEYSEHYRLQNLLLAIAREEHCQSLAHLADGQLAQLLPHLLGEHYTRFYKTYLAQLARSPYQRGWGRLAQRSSNLELYVSKAAETLYSFYLLSLADYDEATLLGNPPEEAKENYGDGWHHLLDPSLWIEANVGLGNPTVIEHLREAMLSDNNHRVLTRGHLRAVARGGNTELIELYGRLLLAARLQEGLRQSIMETSDEGTPEAFWHILELVDRENLIRFSSVKRALACSTGLGEEAAQERKFEKILRLILLYRDDAQAHAEALKSKDCMELYLALWHIGFDDVLAALPHVEQIVQEDDPLRACTALFYLSNFQWAPIMHRPARLALQRWSSDPRVVALAMSIYDMVLSRFSREHSVHIDCYAFDQFYPQPEEVEADFRLIAQCLTQHPKTQKWEALLFSWQQQEWRPDQAVEVLMSLAMGSKREDLLDELLDYLSYSSYRGYRLKRFFAPHKRERHRQYLFTALADRETETRNLACEWLRSMELRPEEILQLEDHLRLKATGMRIAIIQKLAQLPEPELRASVQRLLADKSADRRLAGLDILQQLRKQKAPRPELCTALLPLTAAIAKPTAKEQQLLALLHETPEATPAEGETQGAVQHFTQANGFGFFNPSEQFPLELRDPQVDLEAFFAPLTAPALAPAKAPNRVAELLRKLAAIIDAHREDEVTTRWGEKSLLGKSIVVKFEEGVTPPIETLACPHLWRDFYTQELQSNFDLVALLHLSMRLNASRKECFHHDLAKKMYEGIDLDALVDAPKGLDYREHVSNIVHCLFEQYYQPDRFLLLSTAMLLRLLPHITADNYTVVKKSFSWEKKLYVHFPETDNRIYFWMDGEMEGSSDEVFTTYFAPLYNLLQRRYTRPIAQNEKSSDRGQFPRTLVRAFRLGLIPEAAIYRMLLDEEAFYLKIFGEVLHQSARSYHSRLFLKENKGQRFEVLRPLIEQLSERLTAIELRRGDSPTEATPFVHSVPRLEGSETFVALLAALGKDKVKRLTWSANREGKAVAQSHLLSVCRPLPSDTGKELARLCKASHISPERLVEAAMFVPAWLPLVEEALGWKGLTSAAYYFRAHTIDYTNGYDYPEDDAEAQQEKAIVARYTPIDFQDLAGGAFDIEWFQTAYKTLGKARFELVYEAAKYVSENNAHSRARKFADAVRGQLKAAATLKEIKAKRNKDLLMAYGLIPLGRKGEAELLARYRYIQQFLKESREFGAQRQTSEKQAADIALKNLARNSAYGDVTRLIWSMETLLIEEMKAAFTPQKLEDVELSVQLDAEGKPSLLVTKEGKTLKALPAKHKKHKLVLQLREVVQQLKDQHSRSRLMLEQAMEERTTFRAAEIGLLTSNPVVWPLMQHLVFFSEDDQSLGFYREGALLGPEGEINASLTDDSLLRLAHAVDLYRSGHWSDYQRHLFAQELKQPFKQVFRELYLPTADEKEQHHSLRYAGQQIMPHRAVALLKKRKWVATHEEGLQRIYHKEGIIVTLYALADWFSPSDIEAPAIEYVVFSDRLTGEELPLEKVPPVLFSEAMRDVDLVVSVAHVGGVDPEASHSTIEMRAAIVACALPLFRITNVEIKGAHALIQGSLGRYSVHLGSAVVHQDAGAAIHILPVHSQARGRLFLPFVDEDPKTAEILAKILLLADDERIKDPSILEQIVRK